MSDYPPHVVEEVAKHGKEEFSMKEYDELREYVRALQDSDVDMSDTVMNVRAKDLEQEEGVEPPAVHPYTITEWITERMPDKYLGEFDAHEGNIIFSWEAGALEALKY